MYSFAHLLAIVDSLRGTTKGWVATGATAKSTPISTQVMRVMLAHTIVTQGMIWLGLALATVRYGIDDFWAMWLLAAVGSYVLLPTLWVNHRSAVAVTLPTQRNTPVIRLP